MPEVSFMAHISHLQNEVASLQAESRRWQVSAETETQQRIKLEMELQRAKSAFLTLRNANVRLKEECRKTRKQSIQLRVKASASDQGVRQLMAVTHNLAAISQASLATLEGDSPGE